MKKEEKSRYDADSNKVVKAYTIKEIFRDNWDDFVGKMKKQSKVIRPTIMEEAAKIIGCQDPINGFALYMCPDCGVQKRVPFTCKSRFCNTCGAKYSKDRALAMSKTLLKAPHRHVVFTIAETLRPYFAKDRSLLNILFDAAAETIEYRFYSYSSRKRSYLCGIFVQLLRRQKALRTFGCARFSPPCTCTKVLANLRPFSA